ncbi:MAG: type I-E CRISPR-associated protein Cse2/CasB [Pontibacterium sp.]
MSEQMEKQTSARLYDASAEAVVAWHSSLYDNKGQRAQLRRISSPEDVLFTEGFRVFLGFMPERWKEENFLVPAALVAALLAHVNEHRQGDTFISQVRGDGESPKFSELRFQNLIKSQTVDEFYIRCLRAIRIAKGEVNIVSLAGDILQWYHEFNQTPDRDPTKRLAMRWAKDYYRV